MSEKKMWVILADFDDEPDLFYGDSAEVVKYIESWGDYAWDEVEWDGNEVHLEGEDTTMEVAVSFRGYSGYGDRAFAQQTFDLMKGLDADEKLTLSNLIKSDSERGTEVAGNALYHKIMSGAEFPYYAHEVPIDMEGAYEDQYSISFTQDFGLED